MTNWKKLKLGDIIELNYGKSLITHKRVDGKIPVYSSSGITGRHNEILFNGPGVIVGRKGNVGSIFYSSIPFYCIDTAYYVKPSENYDLKFLYYLLQTLGLERLNEDSAIPGLNRETAYSQILAIPTLPTQNRIASILSALDDKIELNRQMNHTLEQMAQALFKKYFVDDIDPENLPEGWRYATYGEFIDSISVTHKFKKPEIVFLNTGDIYNGNVLHQNYSEVNSLPGQAKKSIIRNDILFTEIRPANRRFAFINFDADDFVVSTKLMVLRAKAEIDSLFFYFLLTREETLTDLQNKAEARSGTFPQITFDQVHELKFLLPNNGLIERFDKEILRPNYELIFKNEKEINLLSEMRDSLLPKLMSGEIEVKEAETLVA